MQNTSSIFVFDCPSPGNFVVEAASHSAAHLEFAAQCLHLFRTRFPHHARSFSWIAKGINERLNYVCSIPIIVLRNQRILDRATERKSFMRCAAQSAEISLQHMPQTFSV